MTRFYEDFVQPAYFHILRALRFLAFPLMGAGGLAYGAGKLGAPDAVQIALWVLGFLVGAAAWVADYSGDNTRER